MGEGEWPLQLFRHLMNATISHPKSHYYKATVYFANLVDFSKVEISMNHRDLKIKNENELSL